MGLRDWCTWLEVKWGYVKVLIKSCGCQLVSKVNPNDMLGASMAKYNKTLPIEVIKVESHQLDDALTNLQTKYHTRLMKGVTKGMCVTRYNCHRARTSRLVSNSTRRRRCTPRCGCTFHVDVRMNDGVDNGTLIISIYYGPHSGHVPFSSCVPFASTSQCHKLLQRWPIWCWVSLTRVEHLTEPSDLTQARL